MPWQVLRVQRFVPSVELALSTATGMQHQDVGVHLLQDALGRVADEELEQIAT